MRKVVDRLTPREHVDGNIKYGYKFEEEEPLLSFCHGCESIFTSNPTDLEKHTGYPYIGYLVKCPICSNTCFVYQDTKSNREEFGRWLQIQRDKMSQPNTVVKKTDWMTTILCCMLVAFVISLLTVAIVC